MPSNSGQHKMSPVGFFGRFIVSYFVQAFVGDVDFFSGLWLYIMVFYCLCVFSVYVNANLGICMYFLCLLFRSFISLFSLILICLFLFYIIVVSDACEFSIEREK